MKASLLIVFLFFLFVVTPASAAPDPDCLHVTADQTKWDGRDGTFHYCSSAYTSGPEDGDPSDYRLDCFVDLNGVVLQEDRGVEPQKKLPMSAGVYRFRHAGVSAQCVTASALTAENALALCRSTTTQCGVRGPVPADFPGGDPSVPDLLEPHPVP